MAAPSTETIRALTAVAEVRHANPHSVLGHHVEADGLHVRVLRPYAVSVRIRFEDGVELDAVHVIKGVWEAVREGQGATMDYRVLVTWDDGFEHVQDDPYRFAPTIGELDLHLIGEGRHEQLWQVLGSHVRTFDGPLGTVHGTSFAVWAPNAKAVGVIGDFNGWNDQQHQLRSMGATGVWEIFVPGVGVGDNYKYSIRTTGGGRVQKADPMARRTEVPPATSSVVTQSSYVWGDAEWMAARARRNPHTGPMSVYEVHLGSWVEGLSYVELADQLTEYVTRMGFTHVEFMPVMEHPYAPSWGYQVTGYYAPTSRFGTPDEFRLLVDRLHQAGIGVILDWVPAHFPKDEWALARFDGEALYEHPDPRRGDQPDWGTHVFDFGRTEVRNFLVANALYWLEEFHADGLRVDAVASMLYLDYSREDGQWVANQYGGRENLEAIGLLQEFNATSYKRSPGIVTIAEESTAWPGVTKTTDAGGLGFGLKWNMGWMNDTLRFLAEDPINRQYHHNMLTFALLYAYSENYLLPISHDEVVHGKGAMLAKIPGEHDEKLATLRAYYAYMWAHPGKQLLFMGQEFAQTAEWNAERSLDWWLTDHAAHYRMRDLIAQLNVIYRDHEALWALDSDPAGFEWLNADDNQANTLSFLRYGDPERSGDEVMAVLVSFGGSDRGRVRFGLPRAGQWRVLMDTSGYDHYGSPSQADVVLTAEEIPWDRQPYSAELYLPRMTAIYLAPVSQTEHGHVGDSHTASRGSGALGSDSVAANPAGMTVPEGVEPVGEIPSAGERRSDH